ncbi:AMP-binding protein [Caldimonas sp. KR1-144]|uniref:AMP-binding protein n=1 Tax=Caldimonas sp. KR1-144 TaxID=3400911 RepID=UPI003BFF9641
MDKIWLKSYPKQVPHEIALDDIGSIGDFLAQQVARYPERRAFVSGATGHAISYRELDALSARFAAWLQQQGVAPGARVALMMPNVLQYPVCLFGALRAGCVVVNVNPMYTPRELEHQIKDSGAEAIVILENFAHVLQEVAQAARLRHVVVTGAADLLRLPLRLVAGTVMQVKGAVPPYALPGSVRLRDALFARRLGAPRPVKVAPGDLAFLQYTGGTTGVAKGAMLTHLNVLANARQGQAWSEPFLDLSQEQVTVTAIPLYHVFALGMALNVMTVGGTNVLVADPRNTKAFVKVLSRHRFVSLPAVNTLFNNLLAEPAFERIDFSSLRVALGGGAAVQQGVARRWQALTGVALCEGYGLTECSPTVAVNPIDQKGFSGSIGLPLPSTEVSLRDAAGREVGIGQAGELCVRGPQVMKGYWQRPDETAAVMTQDGFLRTGDIATMDERGYLRIVDRLKDMILVSGFNVYPNEIEDVVSLHDGVAEVAAIGRPDAASGEAVHLCVVRRDPKLGAREVLLHCRQHLTGYKMPRHVHFFDELPKSPVGKVLRRQLREMVVARA